MKTTNEKLTEWAIDKIKKEYKDDICLLVGDDPLKMEQDRNGTCFSYFVPTSENGNRLAKTFIVDGIGYDLYPRSWERIENMANLDDYNPTCLENVQILYYRSEQDKNHFLEMKAKLRKNLKNPEFMFQKALEKLKVAMEIYQTLMFEEKTSNVRMAAGYIADYLSNAVACINQTYFKQSQVNQIAELSDMKDVPDNFIQYYRSILQADSADELKKLSHLMILITRKYLDDRKIKEDKIVASDFHHLADWYQELCYTWRRIYFACDGNDANRAFVWGCYLQRELNTVQEEFRLDQMDLLGKYNAKDLNALRGQAQLLEQYIVEEIDKHGVKLEKYDSVDDFLAENS